MREMKYSGIGWVPNIPSNWEVKRSKYCFNHTKQIAGSNADDYERLALTMNGVIKRSKDDNNGLQPEQFETYQVLKIDQLVFKLIDLQNISTSRVGLSPYLGLVSPAYIVLNVDKSKVCPKFAEQYFLMLWRNQVFNALGDAGVRSSLNATELLELPIVLPPLSEQKRIADFLDGKCGEIDGLVADIQSQIDTLEQYKRSVITETVTKGLNPDAQMKDSGIEWVGMIPSCWKVSPLKYNLSQPMKYGASEAGVDYDENLPRYIRITDITSNNKLKAEGKLSLTFEQANGYILAPNTVLFARSGGTVGKTFLFTEDYGLSAFAGYLISAVTDKTKMLSKWLWYYTLSNSYWEWANRIFTQATIPNIGADKYSNMPIVVPDIDTQQLLITYLDQKCTEIDSIIDQKKEQLTVLENYKKSLIYEYVTGKKEVPVQ